MRKRTYIISLFVVVAVISLVYFGAYQFAISEIGDIPTKKAEIENTKTSDATNNTQVKNSSDSDTSTAKSLAVDSDKGKITSNTQYVLEKYDANSYTLSEEKETMPVELIGMNREELLEYITNYETNPSLSDIENGFVYIELVSFSDDLITIRKTYKPEEINYKYCLVVENGYVTVYYGDRKTVYTYTDIPLSSLPDNVQQQIIDGKQIASLQELYNFLETYST